MATAIIGAPTKRILGDALSPVTLSSTVAKLIAVQPGYQEVSVYCGSQWKLLLVPKLAVVKYYNASTYSDYTGFATDKSSSTHVPLDGMLITHSLELGTSGKLGGIYITVGSNVNAEAATLDVEYMNSAGAWTDVAGDSDGTTSGGATLAVNGLYTWTAPASVAQARAGVSAQLLHWYRFKPSATLSATVDLNEIIPISEEPTYYGYIEAGFKELITLDLSDVGGLQVLSVSGTPALDINWLKH